MNLHWNKAFSQSFKTKITLKWSTFVEWNMYVCAMWGKHSITASEMRSRVCFHLPWKLAMKSEQKSHKKQMLNMIIKVRSQCVFYRVCAALMSSVPAFFDCKRWQKKKECFETYTHINNVKMKFFETLIAYKHLLCLSWKE